MNVALMKKLSKLSIDDRRALIDDPWDSIESELDAAPVTEEVGRLLDERAALARDPKRKKFGLKQIAARHNVKLRRSRSSTPSKRRMTSTGPSSGSQRVPPPWLPIS